ncbi:hypothetical protein [Streptomyces sp. 8N706]|uniref:hypothetical protein n=1 Tax=Streptomyces sp. 8N706 TaxID=3457416 RepID=UPI003FCF9BFD
MEAGPAEQSGAEPEEREERLPLAEISRRLAAEGIEVSADLMRQHRRRRADFPAGKVLDGRELFTVEEIAGYYRPDNADGAS